MVEKCRLNRHLGCSVLTRQHECPELTRPASIELDLGERKLRSYVMYKCELVAALKSEL